jgi:hypothetical protein
VTGWKLSLTKRRLLPPQPGSLFSIRNKELTGGKRRVLSRPQEAADRRRKAGAMGDGPGTRRSIRMPDIPASCKGVVAFSL